MAQETYINFPIELLRGAFDDISRVCTSIIHYAIYERYMTLNFGNDDEKIKSVANYLGINFNYASLEQGENVYEGVKHHKIKTGVKKDLLFEFRDEYKTDNQIAVFAAYCALRSIVGTKPYTKLTNNYLLLRMAGYASNKELDYYKLPEKLERHNTRRRLESIKKELKYNWRVTMYGRGVDGFYCSFKLSLTELVYQAEKIKKNNKENRAREAEKKAIAEAMERLRNEN